ncbi:MAG: S-adenosyl-l-methionine hydroxide adenosyltransferase family protein [Candidatus Bathyarchaeota archaeon]|nr:S-adenosyl-l-methionine hydroxide adenosyltransferase family protein [Candidatus Bathyarchaeota archaeon]
MTSDFGVKDPYVAEMKGVILSIIQNAIIVDVTHEIEKFNIKQGAFALASVVPYFPKGTIHVAVVDPGVGTERLPILIQTKQGYLIGPDNGVLILAAQNQGIQRIYQLSNPRYMQPQISRTFHGRDIFAPAAAFLERGTKPSAFGPAVQNIVLPEFANVKQDGDCVFGEVLQVDSFGNIISNISQKMLLQIGITGAVKVQIGHHQVRLDFCSSYGEAEPQKLLALIGSHGFLEIALNQGSAAEMLHVKTGDKIQLSPE